MYVRILQRFVGLGKMFGPNVTAVFSGEFIRNFDEWASRGFVRAATQPEIDAYVTAVALRLPTIHYKIPPGGNTGQTIVKKSDLSNDVDWEDQYATALDNLGSDAPFVIGEILAAFDEVYAAAGTDRIPTLQLVYEVAGLVGADAFLNGLYYYKGLDTDFNSALAGNPVFNRLTGSLGPEAAETLSVLDTGGGLKAVLGGSNFNYESENLYSTYANFHDALQALIPNTGGEPAPTTVAAKWALLWTNAAVSEVLSSYLAVDVLYNNTAALADTALSIIVATGGIYDIELTVHQTSTVKALKLDFAGTASVTNVVGEWLAQVSNTSVTAGASVTQRVSAVGTDFTATDFDGVNAKYSFKGTIEVNAGGTFLLRGAQNVANASDTTILRGSTLRLTKLN